MGVPAGKLSALGTLRNPQERHRSEGAISGRHLHNESEWTVKSAGTGGEGQYRIECVRQKQSLSEGITKTSASPVQNWCQEGKEKA